MPRWFIHDFSSSRPLPEHVFHSLPTIGAHTETGACDAFACARGPAALNHRWVCWLGARIVDAVADNEANRGGFRALATVAERQVPRTTKRPKEPPSP